MTHSDTGNESPKKVILLVDDEAIIILALSRELRRAFGGEYRIETALDAKEAFAIIEEVEKEGCELIVVVSDWLMPGMKGDEFLVRLRERYPKLALFMVTGQADESAVQRVLTEAKVVACLRKPWRGPELVDLIRNAVKPL